MAIVIYKKPVENLPCQASTTALAFMLLLGCSNPSKDVWEDIDYTRLRRDNDTSYVQPSSITNCIDDDLYNCNKSR